MEDAHLLRKEFVVICKATSRLLNRLASPDGLKQLDEQGVVCASCGRRLSEERLERLLSPTELAKSLLDHSRWMAAILLDSLHSLGVSSDRVLLEFREGNEEVDAFVDIDGSLAMVELKDKEFSMGHAYPLSGRIAMYHPEYVVIVTSERVAPEVRDYFQRIKPEARLSYVEGFDSLQGELKGIVDMARGQKAAVLLERFNPLTIGVDIPTLIGTKLGISLPSRERPGAWTRHLFRF